MRLTSWAGLLILLLGVILIAYNRTLFVPTQTIPELGLLGVLLGPLIFVAGVVQGRFIGPFTQRPTATVAWIVLAAGLLIALYAFLLQSDIICACPASGLPCNCTVPLYSFLSYSGLFFAAVSAVFLASQLRRVRAVQPAGTWVSLSIRRQRF
jgi:hypothetical protein